MKTIYDSERSSYNRTGWKNRKRRLRVMGLRSGDWHTMSSQTMNEGVMRNGMVVQNITGRPTQYRVIVEYGRVLLEHLRNGKVREINNPGSYKWVRG